jgi:hypothetical protein
MVVLLLSLFMKTATERRVIYFHYFKKMYPKLRENSISWVSGGIIFSKEPILLQEISKCFFFSVWYGSGLVHINNIVENGYGDHCWAWCMIHSSNSIIL